jgi:hypothetical protein
MSARCSPSQSVAIRNQRSAGRGRVPGPGAAAGEAVPGRMRK